MIGARVQSLGRPALDDAGARGNHFSVIPVKHSNWSADIIQAEINAGGHAEIMAMNRVQDSPPCLLARGSPAFIDDMNEMTGNEEIMSTKKQRYRLPSNVDEAAELLVSDMLIQHLQALSRMTDGEFELLCEKVTPYLIEEFRLWQGNTELLQSCCRHIDDDVRDPARVILNRVKQMLQNFHGFVVIT